MKNTTDKVQEIVEYFSTLKTHYKYHFKTNKYELYEFIFEYTKFLDKQNPTFRSRLNCVLQQITQIPICQNEKCNHELDIHDCRPNQAMPKYCCYSCANSSKQTQKLKKQTLMEHFNVDNPAKLEKTKEASRIAIKKNKDKNSKKTKRNKFKTTRR